MRAVRHVIYLHGFASSPESSKAQRFRRELERYGVGFTCPDLNEPAFETLTVTRMLDDVGRALASVNDGPVAVIGSSLGGFVAVHAAEQASRAGDSRVDRVIALAPAFDFGGNRLRQLGEHGLEEWRREGRLRVMHYASNTYRDIGYELYADAAGYDAFAIHSTLPMLVYQGTRDETVDPEMVKTWCADRPNVTLRLLNDDHQLTASMDEIWDGARGFLGLP
jgi:pimeloyl-ACP methyl ester carboxylesterase